MRLYDTQSTSLDELQHIFNSRLETANDAAEASVKAIIADVRSRGEAAVLEYTRRWDCPSVDSLQVPAEAIHRAVERVRATPLYEALQFAAGRIRAFHEKQLRTSWMDVARPGEMLGQIIRPIRRVGVYVPGGTAAYPSTVLMTCIPALVAGVPDIVVTTPPDRETGLPPDATLAACQVAGVETVCRMGGAQAIAALAYGAGTIAAVDKIVGPGNLYVNLAKRLVYGQVGIDMLAGPSEVAALADADGDPESIAADILTQCEHDANSSALLVSPARNLVEKTLAEIEQQLADLPRADIVRRALAANGFAVTTTSLNEAARVVSLYAPEHLHLYVQNPFGLLGEIENAGAILIGAHTSAPLGDYVVGPSHTLPTAGCARFASPLHVDDFQKKSSLLSLSGDVARALSGVAVTLAEFEGLVGHARAATRHA